VGELMKEKNLEKDCSHNKDSNEISISISADYKLVRKFLLFLFY